jgi:hypothetical protein
MDFDYNFYRENFGSPYFKEKPGTAEEFELNVPGLEVDESLRLRVIQVWNHMFEHDEDISAVLLGDKVLYSGKLNQYDDLVERISNNEYELGLNKKGNLYLTLVLEGEIVE